MRTLLLIFSLLFSLEASTLYKTTSSNPSRLNPLLAADSASGDISAYIFTGLLKYDKEAKIVCDLAERYEILSATRLRFYLRRDVRWHDGAPFSAKDVLFTYKKAIDKAVASPYSVEFRLVKSVKAVDTYTVEVEYTQPYFKMLEIWMMGIIPEHILSKEPSLLTAPFNQAPVGTGPYRLEALKLGKEIVLSANETYYEHKPSIEKIIFSIVPDPATRFYMLQKGEIDLGGLDAMQWAKKLTPSFTQRNRIISEIDKSYTYLGFNLERKKFTPKIRQAIALAIDREEIVKLLFFGKGQPCYGPFLPGTAAYNPAFEKRSYDPERARSLLAEEGFDARHPFVFELTTNTGNPIRKAAAEIIQHQLSRVGVKVKLRMMEWQGFLMTVVFPKAFDAVLLGWGLSIVPDAYAIWHSQSIKPGGFNVGSFRNPKVDALIEKAEREVNREAFGAIYREIFAEIVKANPYVFLYIPHAITAVNRRIRPIEPSIVGIEHNIIDWIKE